MRIRSLIIYFLSITLSNAILAQGINFFEGTWQEALKTAKEQDKIIFVDAYAVWCGPCKRMAKTVFPEKKVGDYFNSYFINVKMDMERGEGLEFRKKYPVTAFPTLFFIDQDGKIIMQVVGAKQVDDLILLGEQAVTKVDKSDIYAASYNNGDKSPELVYKYVQALNRSGKSSLKIVNEYLLTNPDFSIDQNLKFILEATTVADSKIFDLLLKYRQQIENVTSKEIVQNRILTACEGTVERAIEYQSLALLEEAKDKMKRYFPEKAVAFALEEDMHYFLAVNDMKGYLESCKKFAKKEAKGDAEELEGLALTILKNFSSKNEALILAEEFSKEATKSSDHYGFFLTYARVLDLMGKKKEALEAAKKSLELAHNENNSTKKMIEGIISKIQNT